MSRLISRRRSTIDGDGGLRPMAEIVAAVIERAAQCSRMPRPFPARLAQLARELRCAASQRTVAWRVTGGDWHRP